MSSERSTRVVFALAAVLLVAAAAVALAWGGVGRSGEVASAPGPAVGPAAGPSPAASAPGSLDEAARPRPEGGQRVEAEAGPDGEAGSGGGPPAAEDAAGSPAPRRASDTAQGAGDAERSGPGTPRGAPQGEATAGDTDAATPTPSPVRDPRVDRILARAESAYAGLRSLRANFEQEVHVPLLERRRHGTGIWYQKGRSRFKMDFEKPPEDVIVADGVHLWLYYPSTNPKQVIRQSLEAETTSAGTADVLARILAEARTGYAATYGAEETVAGVSTHRIDLRPLGRSPYRRVRVWIGEDDHLVRRFEIVEENETVRTVTLRDLEPDAIIPDDIFRFLPPADADVFAG